MISFIVPAHDEAQLIGDTLAALHEAARGLPGGYEIVVVDDASADATAQIAASHGARIVAVQYRHIAATRNAGARAARGEMLVFVDADTLVDARVARAALAALESGAVGGGAAVRLRGDLAWHERAGVAWFVWLFRVTRIAPGCFLFCTRAAFDAAGGFDETYYAGEDVALSRALARQGRFVILREAVRTSGRKLRTFSLWEHLRFLLRFARRGRRMLRSRQGLELWYGKRRDGPR
jgi:glycosyltransferase involved in cell wall biosynthesis